MSKGSRGGRRSNSFTQSQQEAIEYYASGDGMYLNNMLRGRHGYNQSDLTGEDRQLMRDLDKALNKSVTDDVLYRSVDASAVFGNVDSNILYDLVSEVTYGTYSGQNGAYAQNKAKTLKSIVDRTVGKTITDKGYVSTTRDASIAENWGDFSGSNNPVVMKIKTSKSTKGADISKATKQIRAMEQSSPQKETLLARGQKYKIQKVYAKNGMVYVDVEM